MFRKLINTKKDKGILYLFSSRVIIQICTILQSIIIARILGPEGKGYFTEITIYPTLIASISMLGLYTGIVKLAAKESIRVKFNIINTIIKNCFIVGVVGSIIAFIVNTYFFSKFDNFKIASQVFSGYVLIYTLNRGLSAYNNGTRNLKLFSISSVVLYPSYFIVICILWLTHNISISTCIYALLFANLLSLIFLYIKNDDKFNRQKSYSPIKLFRYSLKFSIADFAEPIYLYFDKAIMAFVLSAYDLGIYTIAISSAGLINLFSNTISIKLFSDIANKDNSGLLQYTKYNMLLMSISAILMVVILPIVIPLLYGSQYNASIIPSIIALGICIMQGQSYILERSILATGRPYVGVHAKIIGMIILCVIMTTLHAFGIASVLNATLAAFTTSVAYYLYISQRAKTIFRIKESLLPNISNIQDIINRFKNMNS